MNMTNMIISLVVAVLVILFGAKIRKAKEEENKYTNFSINNTNTPAGISDANKNLKTGDALNFSSYNIPEYKGYHFEAGVGYVRDKKQIKDDAFIIADGNNPLNPTYPFSLYGIYGKDMFDDD